MMPKESESPPSQTLYRAALYMRLSKEDKGISSLEDEGISSLEDEGISSFGIQESNSIQNQRALLLDYLKLQPDIQISSQHVDDGYSGATFERPAFQAMLKGLQKGIINCVIVKDLSRFGRNYIESGRYIEEIFPFLGVRFISVNDQYDSLEKRSPTSDLLIPFKNLINDAYCRDISTKIRSQFEVKRNKGAFIGSFAAYGYCKAPENHNRLIIDNYAAEIIRDIFRWKLSGMSQQHIAKRLNEEGILSPMEYKTALGLAYECGLKGKGLAKWTPSAVTRILTRELYVGTMEQGKQQKPDFRSHRRINVPQEEWICVPGTHDPIIPKAQFDAVARLMRRDTRVSPGKKLVYPLSGLLQCGDCRRVMIRKTVSAGGQRYPYYICAQNKENGGCSSHRIRADAIEQTITFLLQILMALLETVKPSSVHPVPLDCSTTTSQRLEEATRELKKYELLLADAYGDYWEGLLNEKEYGVLRQIYGEKCTMAETSLENALTKSQHQEFPAMHSAKKIDPSGNLSLKKVSMDVQTDPKVPDRGLLLSLMAQILIFEGGRSEILLPKSKLLWYTVFK